MGVGVGIGIGFQREATIHPHTLAFAPIFMHNIAIGMVLVVGGLLTFGIVTTLFLGFNATMLGMTVTEVWNRYGPAPLIHGMLPHGVVEITGTLILNTLGYESYRIFKTLKADATADRRTMLHVREVLGLFVVGVVLIGIAALIESTISRA